MNTTKPDNPKLAAPDPVWKNGLREMWIILGVCAVTLAVVTSVSYGLGLPAETGELQLIMGMPRWVVLGVLVPWIAATIFAVWFGLCYMTDDDLGSELEEESLVGEEGHDV
ncbi:MAG: hypothetical protein COA78_19785 [Blastopirellula sp.]|nr:MAG: hypothetical protein COA78_19785 [Blastopirellula sp.]